jgi:hypothetical protein
MLRSRDRQPQGAQLVEDADHLGDLLICEERSVAALLDLRERVESRLAPDESGGRRP